jgi:hypothetical protein
VSLSHEGMLKIYFFGFYLLNQYRYTSETHFLVKQNFDYYSIAINDPNSGLRHRSAAARLLGLQVRIPPVIWMSLSCECCVLSGRGLCVGLTNSSRGSLTERGVVN